MATTSDPGWKLTIEGVPMARREVYGWANQFDASRTGDGHLVYDAPLARRLATVGQALFWVVVVVVRRRSRRLERADAARWARRSS